MKISSSIRNKLIAAIFIGCLIPFMIGGLYLKTYTENWLYQNNIETTKQLLYRVSDLIDDSLLSDMEQEVNMMAMIPSVKDVRFGLQNYTDYNSNTFRYSPGEKELALIQEFGALKLSHWDINFVFYGTEDGGYMEVPRFQAKAAYDPRQRPWYQQAMKSDNIVVSEPYLTKVTQEMVISFTKKILDGNGDAIGVLGLTVNLNDLTANINNIKIGDSGYILVLSPGHEFLVSPKHPEWIMKTPEELGLSEFENMGAKTESDFNMVLDGTDCVLNEVTSASSGWHIISVVAKSEILHKAQTVSNILYSIYMVTFLLILFIILQISKRFSQPILEISGVIDRMTDFDYKISGDLGKYMARADEIGTVATALVEMNENYTASRLELLEQLDKVDRQNEYINYLALHDSLTRLPNRRQFIDLLTERLESGKKGAVILLDLDDFKWINDTLGHVFGDRVIEAVAGRLAEIAAEKVIVCRFGGDEFLVLVERSDDAEELEHLIRRIRELFEGFLHIENNDIEIRFSIGISLFPEDGTDVNQLVMNADLAMYSVKDSGKNNYNYFDSAMMNSRINQSRIEIVLRDAIENEGFKILYQPQIDLKSGSVYGYEALLRLRDADISPAEFVPVAEINGSIIKIGRIVTEMVIRQLAAWKAEGLELKPVSVNFSVNQLHDSGYLHFIGKQLERYRIEPKFIEIEITESIVLENKQATLAFLKKLKELGISISIDDFGTGYSSLNYMTFLPVDKIKLDRSLNMRFLEMNNDKVMESLISLVHSLGLAVLAEGIEIRDHIDRLKHAECDLIQGYYYSRPLDPEQVSLIHNKNFEE